MASECVGATLRWLRSECARLSSDTWCLDRAAHSLNTECLTRRRSTLQRSTLYRGTEYRCADRAVITD
ncbi:MAG: hypothetical protein ACI8PT_000152 [Gammaproteobacteria bacterium]|jgi:hypothetical protein